MCGIHGAASVTMRSMARICSRDRHGAAEAMTDQRHALANFPQQRQQQLLDVPATDRLARSFALPQSSSSARRPIAATASASDVSSSRSRICGGLISEGMSKAGGPSPPWSRKRAPPIRAISGSGAGRSPRGVRW